MSFAKMGTFGNCLQKIQYTANSFNHCLLTWQQKQV